jgi:hypothetical protein
VSWPGDEHPVQAFGAGGADPTFGVGIRAGRPRRRLQHPNADAGEDRVERGAELGVPVPDEEPEPVRGLAEIQEQVPRGLGNPVTGGMDGNTEEVDAPAVDLDHEQHVQPGQSDGLDAEEVAGQRPGRMGPQERHPTRASVPTRSRSEPVRAQDPSHRRRRHHDAEPAGFTNDPLVAPARVLPRQPHHEVDDVRVEATSGAGVRVGLAAGHEFAVPTRRVAGVTRNTDHRCRGRSDASHARTSRSIPRSGDLTPQDRQLVPQDRDLDVLRVRVRSQPEPSHQASKDQQANRLDPHERDHAIRDRRWSAPES